MTRTKVTVSWSIDKYETELDRELLKKETSLISHFVYILNFREIARYEKRLLMQKS